MMLGITVLVNSSKNNGVRGVVLDSVLYAEIMRRKHETYAAIAFKGKHYLMQLDISRWGVDDWSTHFLGLVGEIRKINSIKGDILNEAMSISRSRDKDIDFLGWEIEFSPWLANRKRNGNIIRHKNKERS